MERDNIPPERTPDRTTRLPLSDTSRQYTQRTPKTPSSARIKTVSKNRITSSPGTTPSSVYIVDSTTPVYHDSAALHTNYNPKLQLADMQPINAKVLERIKSLEISVKQHRDVEEQLRRTLHSKRQEHDALKEQHAKTAESWETKLADIRSRKEQLRDLLIENTDQMQDLMELSLRLEKDLSENSELKASLVDEITDMNERRDEIIQDREETELEAIEHLQTEKWRLGTELEELDGMLEGSREISKQMENTWGKDAVEGLQAELRELRELIAVKQADLDQKTRSMTIDEDNAAELMLKFEKVSERRIRELRNENAAAIHHAEETEKQRKQDADAAEKEYKRVNEIAAAKEEMASEKEWDLLLQKQEGKELTSTLMSLESKINQLQE
ncbi:hypothetical protein BGX28_007866 [Mortierella sp. GBA30]|nr:hypothetical protein BGX28_007866 [Mortierella sp. GBA30]